MLVILAALPLVDPHLDVQVDFAREVRPILAARCFACHGPDEAARKAHLRLDLEDQALLVIDRENHAESELLQRLRAEPAKRMPPQGEEPLTLDELEVLERWLRQGAPWSAHWAFVAPSAPALPDPTAWGRGPIDAFVEARLAQAGLRPAPQAERHTLLRRVTLDLTGLPPTPEEILAFVGDDRPDAYERVVERLLGSPAYGERMALAWLDVARYADTNGYSIDGGRHMWAWRDWVIAAFNDNKPFDRFTVEQLAGDLLADATDETRIASGFNRNHMNTHEGGTIEEEYLVEYAADRVATTAQAWMGLTVGCARCHDHKYDPLSQREYYQFFAYFNSIADRGNDGNGGKNSVPFLPVYSEEQQRELAQLELRRGELEAALAADTPERRARFEEWVAEAQHGTAEWNPPALGPWRVAGPFTAADGDEAFRTDYGPEPGGDGAGAVEWVERADLVDGQAHALPTPNTATYLARPITCAQEGPLDLYFGSDDSIRVWWNGALVLDENVQRGVAPDQERVQVRARADVNVLLVKIVNYGGPGGVYFRLGESGPPEDVLAALRFEPGERSEAQWTLLRDYHRQGDPALSELRGELAALEADQDRLEASPLTTSMVMQDRQVPRPTHVLMRGAYDQKGEQVGPGTPAILPPLPPDAPANRLGLAQWLVDPSHPLTARVAVNSYWQLLFGAGLVETPEDFGTRGSLPSHPELLDWLAVEFVESGWDVKALMRRLVTSATYRQDSTLPEALRAIDPGNRLLARGPRFRLQAELIRDVALSASGLLVPRVGGPSARPYQPDGLWREMSHFGSTPATEQVYVQDHGEGLYRRGMYTIWKRTVPPPTMVAFDAPSREVCAVRRSRTNTPLQALVLLNETGFVEAARALGQRVLLEGGVDDASRLRYLYLLTLGREPSEAELDVVASALERERERYADRPADATALISVGEAPRDTSLAAGEHAAWTLVAALLLNLSETVTKG